MNHLFPDAPCPWCGRRGCNGSCEAPGGPELGECPSCVAQGGLCRACEDALSAEADYYETQASEGRGHE
jgi:hypothetical protein